MRLDPRIGPIQPIDYSILHQTRNIGEIVGVYLDQPIYETVIDEFDRRFNYRGLAPRLPSGGFDTQALGPGEFILLPGLLYVSEPPRKASASARRWSIAPQPDR